LDDLDVLVSSRVDVPPEQTHQFGDRALFVKSNARVLGRLAAVGGVREVVHERAGVAQTFFQAVRTQVPNLQNNHGKCLAQLRNV